MKIGLIEPRIRDETLITYNPGLRNFLDRNPGFFPVFNHPNLGLLTLAAQVPDDWEIKYIETFVDEIDYDESFDIVAISALTRQVEQMTEIAKKFKSRSIYIIAGGIHASVLPDEVLRFADTVFIGEAELTFPQFIEDYLNRNPKRIYSASEYVDLTTVPIPRFDLIQKKYQNYPIQTTRGCPHKCKFCAASLIYGEGYRHKDPDQVVEEIRFLKTLQPDPFIIFSDDNMFVNKTFSTRLLEKLIPLNIKFQSQTDIRIGKDEGFLKLLNRAGCKEVFIGFESLSPEVLEKNVNSRWKSRMAPEYKSLIQNIQNHGIRVYGAFILGFENDTLETARAIRDFFNDTNIIGQTSILTPFPGTILYDEFKKSDRILENKSWKYYTMLDCVIRHNHFSHDDLEKTIAENFEFVYSKEHTSKVMRRLIDSSKGTY